MGRVMNINYSLCRTTGDRAYLLPNDIFTIPEKSTMVEIHSEIIKSWAEHAGSTALSINLDVKNLPVVQGDEFAGQCESSFLSETLVLDYGTYVLTSVDAGASLMKEDYIRKSFVDKSDERSITVSASTSFFKVVEFGLDFKSTNKLKNAYDDNTTYSLMLTQGGIPYYPGITLKKWQESISNNLVAQDRSGLPLPFFLNRHTLPDMPDPTLLKLANAVSQAILRYYTINTHPGCTKPGSTNYNYQANVDDESCEGLTENLNLGGVFQQCTPLTPDRETQQMCQTLIQNNPQAGAMKCNPPYKQTRLRTEVKEEGQTQVQCRRECRRCRIFFRCCKNVCGNVYRVQRARVETFWCTSNSTSVLRTPGFLFGGLYGPELVNALTKSKRCPLGFIPYTLLSDGLKICLSSSYEVAARFAVPFGGLFSCEAGNPMAGGLSRCPAGFTQHSAGVSDGCELLFCVRSGTFSQGELPQIQLPPFTRRPLLRQNANERVTVVSEQGRAWVRQAGSQQWTRASAEEAQLIEEDTSSGAPVERGTPALLLAILLSALEAIL
ncbi:macrophage-expressed gene 1 protein-like [Conger conger]|uniref:macrophage-expressed gene 1 protein-like n=1 Tax=Conger conger TaxID=82655 RepID=UPI002A5A1C27|nr:macrophage-expressed gene 1 protein-like [Conger conger]